MTTCTCTDSARGCVVHSQADYDSAKAFRLGQAMTTERPLSAASEALMKAMWMGIAPEAMRPRLAAIEDAARVTTLHHPDDGHEHRYTCIRCGVDPYPAHPARATAQAEVARLREALLGVSDGEQEPCWCPPVNMDYPEHRAYCEAARAALASTPPEGQE